MRRIIVLPAALAIALAGGTAGLAAAPDVNDQDRSFLVAVHEGNLAEIQSGRHVETQAAGKAVRDAGTTLVDDHTKLDEHVRRVADEVGVRLPGEPGDTQRADLRRFSAMRGTQLDTAWVAAEITEHKEDLAAIAKEQTDGSSDKVMQLARDAEPVVESHLKLLEHIRTG
ncbi:DUF4142 domain-containing protein [Planotetraspora mira]|uniref:DUF4142 domain-containing protein n=1 Tax=Planotetraspora mira TaxID=58121 RepID=A0A8J3TJU8_9ACTN|nr:DUF4142 domain-containing protein [Planotetraspora mira]GII27002.1 hypothetical protein Pmi06nite_04440 [Planotetraspora mira]